jgi:hypothetical protein
MAILTRQEFIREASLEPLSAADWNRQVTWYRFEEDLCGEIADMIVIDDAIPIEEFFKMSTDESKGLPNPTYGEAFVWPAVKWGDKTRHMTKEGARLNEALRYDTLEAKAHAMERAILKSVTGCYTAARDYEAELATQCAATSEILKFLLAKEAELVSAKEAVAQYQHDYQGERQHLEAKTRKVQELEADFARAQDVNSKLHHLLQAALDRSLQANEVKRRRLLIAEDLAKIVRDLFQNTSSRGTYDQCKAALAAYDAELAIVEDPNVVTLDALGKKVAGPTPVAVETVRHGPDSAGAGPAGMGGRQLAGPATQEAHGAGAQPMPALRGTGAYETPRVRHLHSIFEGIRQADGPPTICVEWDRHGLLSNGHVRGLADVGQPVKRASYEDVIWVCSTEAEAFAWAQRVADDLRAYGDWVLWRRRPQVIEKISQVTGKKYWEFSCRLYRAPYAEMPPNLAFNRAFETNLSQLSK